MPKKHKAKGNQQKSKRKSFRNESLRASSGSSSPFFSMRDEALTTERHHKEWSPSVKLRHQAISFVSAGTTQPLKEPEVKPDPERTIEDSASVSDPKETTDINAIAETNNEVLADMQIQDVASVKSKASVHGDDMDVDFDAADILSRALAEQDDSRPASPQLFVIDRVGDASLKPALRAPSALVIPDHDIAASDEDEVIVFRGRRGPRIVQDEVISHGPTQALATPATALPDQSLKSDPAPENVVNTFSAPLAEALQTAGLNPVSSRKLAGLLNHDSERPKADPAVPLSGGPKLNKKQKKREKRHARAARKGAQRHRNALEAIVADGLSDDDIDDEMVQDYIANISGAEDILSKSVINGDSDDWESSVLGEGDETEVTGEIQDQAGDMTDATMQTDMLDMEEDEDVDEDEEGDSEDNGSSAETGDDSDLESDLENSLREQWQDEEDLRQRQIDALTDEEIARILAKQEDLGMGSDEILLLDDSGFGDLSRAQAGLDAILANPSHPHRQKPKRGKRRSDHFPSASLMADVIEQDPYGGFDVMDFDRPSLRANTKGRKGRKSAGPLPEELLGISDDELIADLQSAWATDRSKKAAKKQERESLRAQGLLGGSAKSNKFKPDLSARYSEGLSLSQLRAEIEEFLEDDDSASKAFPPMDKRNRKLLHEVAHVFDLTSTSRGSGANRFTVMSKRATRTPDSFEQERWERVLRIVQTGRGYLRTTVGKKGRSGINSSAGRAGRGGGFSKAAVGYANGEVVGATAPEIGQESFGRRLMEKMGWEKGMALGKEGGTEGLLVPVQARIKSGRGGLG